jgi:hypothetical protein
VRRRGAVAEDDLPFPEGPLDHAPREASRDFVLGSEAEDSGESDPPVGSGDRDGRDVRVAMVDDPIEEQLQGPVGG